MNQKIKENIDSVGQSNQVINGIALHRKQIFFP